MDFAFIACAILVMSVLIAELTEIKAITVETYLTGHLSIPKNISKRLLFRLPSTYG